MPFCRTSTFSRRESSSFGCTSPSRFASIFPNLRRQFVNADTRAYSQIRSPVSVRQNGLGHAAGAKMRDALLHSERVVLVTIERLEERQRCICNIALNAGSRGMALNGVSLTCSIIARLWLLEERVEARSKAAVTAASLATEDVTLATAETVRLFTVDLERGSHTSVRQSCKLYGLSPSIVLHSSTRGRSLET